MSPTSYRTAPPRISIVTIATHRVKPRRARLDRHRVNRFPQIEIWPYCA
jgi:hypothetical protein